MHRLWPTLCPEVQRKEAHADAQGQLVGLVRLQMMLMLMMLVLSFNMALKVWPMGVASTVSRLPITVKVVPMSSNEEQDGRGQQQQQQQQGVEAEAEEPQQQSAQTQGGMEAAHAGESGRPAWLERSQAASCVLQEAGALQTSRGSVRTAPREPTRRGSPCRASTPTSQRSPSRSNSAKLTATRWW